MRLASIQLYSGFDFIVSDRFISPTHLPAVYSVESSAYISKRMSDISRMESFMNVMKSRGPSIDPWGTPIVTGSASESTPSYFTLCFSVAGLSMECLAQCNKKYKQIICIQG